MIKKHKLWIIAIIVLILIDTFITGYIKFAYNVTRCGGMPVAVNPGSSFASGYPPSYTLPGDRYYDIKADKNYVCTEDEAKSRGLEINPFTEKANERLHK